MGAFLIELKARRTTEEMKLGLGETRAQRTQRGCEDDAVAKLLKLNNQNSSDLREFERLPRQVRQSAAPQLEQNLDEARLVEFGRTRVWIQAAAS